MRIGIVCPYDLDVRGGVQQLTQELAQRLRQAGDEVILVGPERSWSVPANQSRAPISLDPGATSQTRRLLADVDVVHVHEPLVPFVGWAGLRAGKPTVATFHADPADWTRRLYLTGASLLGRMLSGVVLTAVSDVAASALPPMWGEVTVIPNAISVASYDVDVPRDTKRVTFLGRDEPRKGLDILLAAWPRVVGVHPNASLLVMGTDRPSTDPSVQFLGRVDEETKRETLASAALYVAPNLGGESFGIVLAEGMAAGCAVVASDLPAFRPVVGNAGRLVPPGDVSALARTLIELLGDPSLARELGSSARSAAERFDWEPVVAAYRETYEAAMATGG